MLVLAIETSCDDTCAAVLAGEAGTVTLLSNLVSSQLIHEEYEGIVPELASREHLRLIGPVVSRVLEQAGVDLPALDAVAVTSGPGLIGSLLVGLSLGKALAYGLGIPVIGINHIEGHLAAAALEFGADRARPPFVGLVASGGHTEIMLVSEWGRWSLLGATRDDAAGEAFDKVAKLLGMGFPGGAAISKAARAGNPEAYAFPRAWLDLDGGGLDLSFSGLKTSVKLFLDEQDWPERPADPVQRARFVADVAASFEEAVVDVLSRKLWKAVEKAGASRVVVAGGVAANRALRQRLVEGAAERGLELEIPSPPLCGDNAAMIGMAALQRLQRGECSSYDLAAIPNLDDWTGHYQQTAP
ncbi:MAG: tRNA (adenosine(37)-N6)-threonylcarbamoyltransferase complex transferase subunit TsaD [Candidatus Eisenbacteria sp.]|nr:tRNA (adenosine(37)-N6)-threonylcarbamoyltransferase complex transferase subunit TsaD [Candidatus Eisenbacteria bacterium]